MTSRHTRATIFNDKSDQKSNVDYFAEKSCSSSMIWTWLMKFPLNFDDIAFEIYCTTKVVRFNSHLGNLLPSEKKTAMLRLANLPHWGVFATIRLTREGQRCQTVQWSDNPIYAFRDDRPMVDKLTSRRDPCGPWRIVRTEIKFRQHKRQMKKH